MQIVRFLDDWAYQANVRKELKKHLLKPSIPKLEKLIKPYEKQIMEKFETNFEIKYSYPWNRFFEIEINL